MRTHATLRGMTCTFCRRAVHSKLPMVVLDDASHVDEQVDCHWCKIRLQANLEHEFRIAVMPAEKRRKVEQMRNRVHVARLLEGGYR